MQSRYKGMRGVLNTREIEIIHLHFTTDIHFESKMEYYYLEKPHAAHETDS